MKKFLKKYGFTIFLGIATICTVGLIIIGELQKREIEEVAKRIDALETTSREIWSEFEHIFSETEQTSTDLEQMTSDLDEIQGYAKELESYQ